MGKGVITAIRPTTETTTINGKTLPIMEIKKGEAWKRFAVDSTTGEAFEIVQSPDGNVTASKTNEEGKVIQTATREKYYPMSGNRVLLLADVNKGDETYRYVQLWKLNSNGTWGTTSDSCMTSGDWTNYKAALDTFWA